MHAVAVWDGAVVAAAGDDALVTFFRSSAKLLQALPAVRERPDLDDAEVAIACASHLARPRAAPVRSLLAKPRRWRKSSSAGRSRPPSSTTAPGSTPRCSPSAVPSWPSEGYRLPDHPCQHAMLAEVVSAAEVDPGAS